MPEFVDIKIPVEVEAKKDFEISWGFRDPNTAHADVWVSGVKVYSALKHYERKEDIFYYRAFLNLPAGRHAVKLSVATCYPSGAWCWWHNWYETEAVTVEAKEREILPDIAEKIQAWIPVITGIFWVDVAIIIGIIITVVVIIWLIVRKP